MFIRCVNGKSQSVLCAVLFAVLFSVAPTDVIAGSSDALRQAVSESFAAKAELFLLKGDVNRGKVYLCAAHTLNRDAGSLRLKAMDMMYPDFPFVKNAVDGYKNGPICFSPDGIWAGFIQNRKLVRLNLKTGRRKVVEHVLYSTRMVISPKGRYVAVCDHSCNLAMYDMEEGELVWDFSFRKEDRPTGSRMHMSFSPDEKTLAAHYSGSDKGGLHFFNVEKMTFVRTMPSSIRSQIPVEFISDGSLLTMVDGKFKYINPDSLEVTKTLELSQKWCWSFDVLSSKNLIAVGPSNTVSVFSTETQEKAGEYQAASHNILLTKFLGEGRYILYASSKRESGIIDCESGRTVQVFNIGRDAVLLPGRDILMSEGKAIDVSACQVREMPKPVSQVSGRDVPDNVKAFIKENADKSKGSSFSRVSKVVKSPDGRLGVYGTKGGLTVMSEIGCESKLVKVESRYWNPVEYVFLKGDNCLLRAGRSNNGMSGAIELYSKGGEIVSSLVLRDPPVMAAVGEEQGLVVVVDKKNRVLLSTIPELDVVVELMGTTLSEREVLVDQERGILFITTEGVTSSFDLKKASKDRDLPSYREASRRFGISLKDSEPLWSLVEDALFE